MTSRLRKGRHSVTDLKIHLICITKKRRNVFTAEGLSIVQDAFYAVAQKMGFSILEFNGEADHVHALIEYPPKFSVSQMANALKGVSSRRYGQAGLPKPDSKHLWSPSYYCSSVGGAPIEILKEYIKNQKSP